MHGYTLGTMPEPVIELLTRPGCHLCEDARLTVSEICAEYGLDYTELDITDNPGSAQTPRDRNSGAAHRRRSEGFLAY